MLKQVSFIVLFFAIIFSCQTSRSTFYKVKVRSGDTLASIASRYSTTWMSIARDNNIKSWRDFKVGDVLLVSPGPGGFVAAGTKQGDGEGFMGVHNSSAPQLKNQKASISSAPKRVKERKKKGGLLFNNSSSLIWPVEQQDVSSKYGMRGRKFHHGIDIRANRGEEIFAVSSGVVTFSGRKRGYGKTVIISHENGEYQTLYAHCLKLFAKKGQRVEQGQQIAKVGRTGNARGYHLHFEVRKANGISLNPLNFLNDQKNSYLSMKN